MRPNFDWSPRLSQEPGDLPTADTVRTDTADPEELMGPSSRPTLNDTPQALEHAFFQAGDDGRYEGGPATIAPVAIDDEPEGDEPRRLAPPDPRVLARRARGARVVALIVGAMASIFAVGLVRSSSSAQQPQAPVAVAAAAPVAVAQPKPVPREAPPKPAALAEPAPMVAAAPAAEAGPAPEPEPAPAPRAKKRSPRAFVAPAAVEEPAPALPAAPPPLPEGPPPTAAFPPAG